MSMKGNKGSGMNTGGLPHKRPAANTGSGSNLATPPNRKAKSVGTHNPFPQQAHTVFKFPK